MQRLLRSLSTALLLAPLSVLTACGSTGQGPTEIFEEQAPQTVFVLAPVPMPVSGDRAELVRREIMHGLREKGYGVTSAADVSLIPQIEAWSSETRSNGSSRDTITISARMLDRQERLLWEDSAQARSESDPAQIERLVAEAVRELLRSLPDAPQR